MSNPLGVSGFNLPWLARQSAAGITIGLSAVIYAISYGAMLFSGPLAPYVGIGIAAAIVTAVVGALFGLLRVEQFLPFRFTGPAGGSFAGLQRIQRAGPCAQFGILIGATGGLARCHPVVERGAGGFIFL